MSHVEPVVEGRIAAAMHLSKQRGGAFTGVRRLRGVDGQPLTDYSGIEAYWLLGKDAVRWDYVVEDHQAKNDTEPIPTLICRRTATEADAIKAGVEARFVVKLDGSPLVYGVGEVIEQ